MSNAHDHARNGNTNALQQEIQRNPNVVNEKSKVRILFFFIIIIFIRIIILITQNGLTPLHCAVDNGQITAVRVLLAAGANCNSKATSVSLFTIINNYKDYHY